MTAVLDRLATLADPTRSRLLLIIERHELTVGELCAVLQLPQSTVSRHLRILADEGWVTSRAEGTSRQYRMVPLDPGAGRLWNVVREEIERGSQAGHDAARLREVLTGRRLQSREFFAGSAAEWDRVRDELFGSRAELGALPALLDSAWTIGDLGCGTGQLAAALAPFVAKVVGVDESATMLASARRRLENAGNAELHEGSLESLPLADRSLDAAVLSLVLHHAVEPADVLREAARVLRPGGRLLIIDMVPHERDEYRVQMGHVWLGFGEAELRASLAHAGFDDVRYIPLPPDPAAKGPNLFAGTARLPRREPETSHTHIRMDEERT
ncbi:MAG TPA: metalloregulator ArsR/SmtB family transcription factor [Gemmatimonadales bacterium]|nr:metalloregulator ArsR/SmtB family transcription factor [Gemmatimonadales bacterium]